jgi:osmotically-inducible protein OsmY
MLWFNVAMDLQSYLSPAVVPKMVPTTESSAVHQELQIVVNHHSHLLKNRLHFDVEKRRVRLHGCVDSYFEKQMAQEAIRNIVGVEGIDNELHVQW